MIEPTPPQFRARGSPEEGMPLPTTWDWAALFGEEKPRLLRAGRKRYPRLTREDLEDAWQTMALSIARQRPQVTNQPAYLYVSYLRSCGKLSIARAALAPLTAEVEEADDVEHESSVYSNLVVRQALSRISKRCAALIESRAMGFPRREPEAEGAKSTDRREVAARKRLSWCLSILRRLLK